MARAVVFGILFLGAALLALIYVFRYGNKQDTIRAARSRRSAVPCVESNPMAFLTSPNVTKNRTLSWVSRVCRGGFRYDQDTGDLLVPEDGRYRVYFQLTYLGSLNCTKATLMLAQWVWYVQESYPKEKQLLAVRDTLPCVGYLSKTLQAYISYDLVKNDRLRVWLSNPELISSGFLGADLE